MSMKFKPLLIFSLLGLSVSPVWAGKPGGADKFMQFFDDNGDGIVTTEEFEHSAKNRFARMDADSNGTLTLEEFKAYVKDRREERKADKMKAMDNNNDKRVSREEFVNYHTETAKQRFSRLDRNNDGVLDEDEFQFKSEKHRHGGWGERIFKKLDGNADGSVTQSESFTAWSNWFAKIDLNDDKVVTQDEVIQYRENKRERRHEDD